MSKFQLGLSGISPLAMGAIGKRREKDRPQEKRRPSIEELRRRLDEITNEIGRLEGNEPPTHPLRDAARTSRGWQGSDMPSQGEFTRREERAHERGVRRNLRTARDIDPDRFSAGRTESKIAKIEATSALQAAQRKANEANRAIREKARITGKYRTDKEDMERRMGLRPEQTINEEVIGSEGYERMVAAGRADMDRQEAQRLTAEQETQRRARDWALKHSTSAKGYGPTPSGTTGGGRVGVLPRRGGRRSITQEEYEYLQRKGF